MKKHRMAAAAALMIVLAALGVVFLKRGRVDDEGTRKVRPPNQEMITAAQRLVKVRVTPSFPFSFDLMKPGVFQHIDRRYTYDVVPPELIDGFLFQGIHRPGKGTAVEFELSSPAKVYFFFHEGGDGGYSAIFAKLDGWKRSSSFPQYDIHNGDHGLRMVMYQLEAGAGTYSIPATTADRACFNIVFQANPGFPAGKP